ncbi:tether containing UBX domain for GLUT4-like isoform X2 [Hydractinia symbiolongicarpus]|nr:tether containing UBX domain for GLUT4-like isoform X2 [Hydractinia symbiolongicarpus]
MMRFLNLANNAKLEMIKCIKTRPASSVTVALQLEDGSRLQHQFNPNTTLWNLLNHFQQKSKNDTTKEEAVCVYMGNEYKGAQTMESTTLKSMGISGGRAAIRLFYRKIEETEVNLSVKAKQTSSSLTDDIKFTSDIAEPNEKKIKLEVVSSVKSDERELSSSSTLQQAALGPPPRSIFPENETVPDRSSIFPANTAEPVEPKSAAVKNEFADFQFPETSNGNMEEEDPAIDPKLMRTEVKLSMPCERRAILYSINSSDLTTSSTEELDDNFFEVTIDDLRKRLTDLKSDNKAKEEAMLLTKTSRQRLELEKLANFQKIPIRFQFPDKTVLQAFFRPLETVKSVDEFLLEYLSDEIRVYEIFTTPPKFILNDRQQTLHKAKLFPAALIHVSTKNKFKKYVKDKYMDDLKTYEEAEAILKHDLERSHGTQKKTNHVNNIATTTPATTASAVTSKTSGAKKRNVPKWFKTGR